MYNSKYLKALELYHTSSLTVMRHSFRLAMACKFINRFVSQYENEVNEIMEAREEL